jgi:hypothetical protein
MVMFVLLGFGSNSRDLVSYLNPDDYFASRKVDVRVEKLLELAAKSPETGKDQVMQLLAIRKLVANPDTARKDERVRDLLTQILERKKGKDRLGFAEEYARQALARLDGKEAPAVTIPKASLRSEAFAWFPKDALIVMGFDARPVAGVPVPDTSTLQDLVTKYMRKGNMDKVFELAEKLGNLRFDRVSVAAAPNPMGGAEGRPNARIYVRITGKADHRRLVSFLSDEGKLNIVRQERGPDKELITSLSNEGRAPVIALVGDSDVLIAGYADDRKGDHMSVLREMLEVRGGQQRSIVAGPLGARLKKVHPQTFILTIGDISKDFGLGPMRVPGIDGEVALPKSVVAEVSRKAAGLDVTVEALMQNETDAERMREATQRTLREAIEDIRREAKRKPDVPQDLIELFTKTLESVKTSAKGSTVIGSVHISNAVMKAVPNMLDRLGAVPGGVQPELRPEFRKDFDKPKQEFKEKRGQRRGALLAPQGAPARRVNLAPVAPRLDAALLRPTLVLAR